MYFMNSNHPAIHPSFHQGHPLIKYSTGRNTISDKLGGKCRRRKIGYSRVPSLKTPGHTALYGLITTQTRQKVVSRQADDVRVDVEFKTSYSRIIDVAGRGEKSERRRTRQTFWTAQNFSPRTTTSGTRGKNVQHMWNTRDTRVPGVIKTWGDA